MNDSDFLLQKCRKTVIIALQILKYYNTRLLYSVCSARYIDYLIPDSNKDINKDNEKLEKMVRDTLIKEFSPKIKDMKSFELLVDATVHNIKQKQLKAMGDYEEIEL